MSSKSNTRLRVSHTTFSLVFTAVLYIVCNLFTYPGIVKWFYLGGRIDYLGLAGFYILGFGLFFLLFIIFSHKWTIKPLAILLVVLSTSATYFISKYGIVIDRSMVMNTVYTDVREVKGLLTVQMLPHFIFMILLPISLILMVKVTFSKPVKYLWASLKLSILAAIISVSMVYLNFESLHRAGNLSRKNIVHTLIPINVIRSSASVATHALKPYFDRTKEEVEFTAKRTAEKDLLVVLAIGETSRQKSFSLYGYEGKNTNPLLSTDKDLHILNGIARVGSTLYALPEILEVDGIKLPTVTSRVGVDTACFVNFTLYDNCAAVGEINVSNCKYGRTCFDEDVIPLLERKMETFSSGGQFVVLHLGGGSHGPSYNDRVPADFQVFKPVCLDADVVNQCSKEQLYNSYDNTILYVDYVLHEIIEKLDQSELPYILIYLSDHGESLLEEGLIFHGMPPGIPLPPEQAEIPLIVKSSIPIVLKEREHYYQQDVFATVLNLFSIEDR